MIAYQVRRNFPQKYNGKKYKAGDTLTSGDIGNWRKERQFIDLNWIVPIASEAASAAPDSETADSEEDEPMATDSGIPRTRGRPARRRHA